jgi:hypothetical protein
LEPVTEVLTPQVAQRILELQADQSVVDRVKLLGDKSNSGTLTEEERAEYESLANAGTLISLFKAKARRFLNQQTS